MRDHVDPARDPMPRSAVSHGAGLSGLVGLVAWYAVAVTHSPRIDGPYAAMVAVAACALPMIAWSILVDHVHRHPSTDIDWDRTPPPLRETLDVSITKLVGLWCTWAIIAAVYCVGRWYWRGNYLFAMEALGAAVPLLLAGSVPYILWIDRRLIEPRDGAWHVGLWLTGRGGEADGDAIAAHARAWAVKGFFTAFMLSGVPGNWAWFVNFDVTAIDGVVALSTYFIGTMFLIDMAMATVGYLLTMRPLDAHIRSANPYAAAWTAALICYPPFGLMNEGGPLDYHHAGAEWQHWLAAYPLLMGLNATILALLTMVYAWATVAFGPRFSNLTNRGILTHGPYRWTKHPAYVSKNLFWWLSAMPFLATSGGLVDVVRNTALMGVVSGIYYWRARTEERHLMADPAYRAYAAWMDRHAPLPRLLRALHVAPRPAPEPALVAAE